MTIKVAILDSGAGGLSIAAEIMRRELNVELIYLADKAFFPYGSRSDDQIIERLAFLSDKLDKEYQPDVFIVACNTASTIGLPVLRKNKNRKVIGVVPAVKPAAQTTQTGHIAVLATEATVKRHYLFDLINEFAKDVNVELIGSAALAEIAEQYIELGELALEDSVVITSIQNELKPLLAKPSIDQLVLACTHFPLLKPAIDKICVGTQIRTVDSTTAIVNRLQALVKIDTDGSKNAALTPLSIITTADAALAHYAHYLTSLFPTKTASGVNLVTAF